MPQRQRQGQQDEAGQAPRGVRGGHERDGTDDPIRELRLPFVLKYFRNFACGDLYALFPNARVVMSNFDKAFLGVPAIAGGIPIKFKLYATISVLFLVAGIYFGGSGWVGLARKNFGVNLDFKVADALETLNLARGQ